MEGLSAYYVLRYKIVRLKRLLEVSENLNWRYHRCWEGDSDEKNALDRSR